PDTAQCVRQTVCNKELCAPVCVPGTVEIDTWAVSSLNFQRHLQRDLPLTHYQLPGTHNAYQTLSSGIGVEEHALHQLFVAAGYRDDHVVLQHQRYSVSDQLRMGLRWIEFDMWRFSGQEDSIRLCHDPAPDPRLLMWVENAENKTGTQLKWDSANLGCFSAHTKNLATGLKEIAAWLSLPENNQEIIVLYYDVKSPFVQDQVKQAINTTTQIFGDRIFSQAEKESLGRWPTANELINAGKQVIVESNSDSFKDSEIIFYPKLTDEKNGGDQFTAEKFTPFPHCAIKGIPNRYGQEFFRALDHSVAKGPALQPDPDKMINVQDIRNFVNCGVSTMALDQVQPSYIAEMIWSWDVNEPTAWGCAVMNAKGRWYSEPDCQQAKKHACVHHANRLDWKISTTAGTWNNASCPDHYQFAYPRTGYENALLTQKLGNQEI
ncbi:MAG TPA: hypothetical protein VI522_05805, partial [Gammaproteobacteria bacterium]|nr:hypothetical protein [Gammaproteobacteria bacterium]